MASILTVVSVRRLRPADSVTIVVDVVVLDVLRPAIGRLMANTATVVTFPLETRSKLLIAVTPVAVATIIVVVITVFTLIIVVVVLTIAILVLLVVIITVVVVMKARHVVGFM